jgi:DNA-binding beta-propeller fold protein YncE
MKRPAQSCKAVFAASFFLLAMMGIAGQAYGTPKPKFVYVANSGAASSGDTIATYSVTATAVCGDSQCALPIAISGTFTLDTTKGIVTGGTMYMTDAKDLASSPLAVPFSQYLPSDFPGNAVVFFLVPGRTSAQSPSYVELIFPFSPFPTSYSGGPLCTVANTTNCGVISGAEIGTANVNPSLYPTTLNGTNLASAEMTSGSVALVGISGGSPGTGTVSGYAVDPTTGALTPVPGSPFAAGSGPHSLAPDHSGKFLFIANRLSNNISAYSVDATTGALTPVPGSPFAAGTDPYAMAADPAANFLYVANQGSNNVSAFSFDAGTGVLTPVPGSPFAAGTGPDSVRVDAAGEFVYVANGGSNNVFAYGINGATGALTPIPGAPFTAGTDPVSMAIVNSSTVPFKRFDVNVAIDEDRRTAFRAQGSFTLGDGTSGVNPVNEDVTFQLGPYSATVPVGSFHQKFKNYFEFEGPVNGVMLHLEIYGLNGSDYMFLAEGMGTIQTWFANPVTVGLTIGDDVGTTSVTADIDR